MKITNDLQTVTQASSAMSRMNTRCTPTPESLKKSVFRFFLKNYKNSTEQGAKAYWKDKSAGTIESIAYVSKQLEEAKTMDTVHFGDYWVGYWFELINDQKDHEGGAA